MPSPHPTSRLITACINRDADELLTLLVETHESINAPDSDGFTALHWAVVKGYDEIVDLLLSEGADANVVTTGHAETHEQMVSSYESDGGEYFTTATYATHVNEGLTPLMLACQYSRERAAQLLISHRASVNRRDENGDTLLIASVGRHYHIRIASLLIRASADLNARGVCRRTALMNAAGCGHLDAVKLLIDAGADIDAADQNDHTALRIAADHRHTDIATVLLRANARAVGAWSSKALEFMKLLCPTFW